MLLELHLRNLAVAEDVTLELGDGLNVLSGRTGAGKSLVVEALRWLRGEDVDRGVLRTGAEVASAEALFDVGDRPALRRALDELGVDPPSDGILRLRREVRREGRTRAYVGARSSSAAVLQSLAALLLEMQSQHEQLSLRQPSAHPGILDELGCTDERAAYDEAYRAYRRVEQRIARARERAEQLRAQRDLIEFQCRELVDAQLTEGELDQLRIRVARMEGGARLVEAVQSSLAGIDGEQGVAEGLRGVLAALRGVPGELPDLVELRDRLHDAAELVEDARRGLEHFLDQREEDPGALERDQARLAELQGLLRKYGRTEAELVGLRNRLVEDLDGLEHADGMPPEMAREREIAVASLQEAAIDLDKARARIGRRAERDAAPLLEELGMAGAALRFDRMVEEDPDGALRLGGKRVRPLPSGPSAVRISVRTNAGERFGPIERVASGGELSRIGLVLRSLGDAQRRPGLLVLDEVDAGLGADLGPALARRLRALAERGQILVISHLPAVAAAADVHLAVQKDGGESRTRSRIEVVEADGRIREIQRMIGGDDARTEELARALLRRRGEDDDASDPGRGEAQA